MLNLKEIAIAVDQLVNTFFAGYADETLSARAWRESSKKRRWAVLRRVIDTLFFWQPKHCFSAYLSEVNRKQLPEQYTYEEGKNGS